MISVTNFVSISELRLKTSEIIKDLPKSGKKIVLSQNKPIGIFLSIDEFNSMQKTFFEKEKATFEDIESYKKSSHGKNGVEAFSFLNNLK